MENNNFFSMWYVIQTAVMNSLFALLGQLSQKETEFIYQHKLDQASLYQDIRTRISPAIIDETNATERTKNYPTMYHNEFFRHCCREAGMTIDQINLLPASDDFVKSILGTYDVNNLLALFMVTEEKAPLIMVMMRSKFEQIGAPENSLAYVDVHELIEGHHAREVFSAFDLDFYQEEYHKDDISRKIADWRMKWNAVLEELEFI